ncbi:MAG: hypothetical protein HZA34_03740 [Candidatus Pacebacteria bacterium]|nr:hypothetical protein [Candidatus Paceibacterota bacterium]
MEEHQEPASASQDAGIDHQQFVPPQQPAKEELLLEWSAPERAFKKRDREYYTTIAVIVFLLSIILFFAGQFLPIAVVVSFAFVSYALAAVPPESAHHQITTYGIHTGGKLYQWHELGRFWFNTTLQQSLLHVEHHNGLPPRLLMLLGEVKKDDMENLLVNFLIHDTPPPTSVEKAAAWLQEKFPLEKNG